MVSLEQVKLLETRVSKAIEFVNRVTDENNRVIEENNLLKGKLESCQKRVDELEALVEQFKTEEGRIEEGILSALDRLSRFEQAASSLLPEKAAEAEEEKAAELQETEPEAAEPEVAEPQAAEPLEEPVSPPIISSLQEGAAAAADSLPLAYTEPEMSPVESEKTELDIF
jgi:FtsZ-binding cell division protein ZapB